MVLLFLSPKNASGKRYKSLFIVKYCYGRTILIFLIIFAVANGFKGFEISTHHDFIVAIASALYRVRRRYDTSHAQPRNQRRGDISLAHLQRLGRAA